MISDMVRRFAIMLPLILTMLACQPTGEPAPSPRPTPAPMAGLDLEYLDYGYLPSGISGDRYVARGSEGEVHIGDIHTGEIRQLTDDGRKKYGPVMSERFVAWTEHHSPSKLGKGRPSSDIFVLDLDSGNQWSITDVPAQRAQLDIHDHRLVWRENRYQGTGYDVYAYDLDSNEETPSPSWKATREAPPFMTMSWCGQTVVTAPTWGPPRPAARTALKTPVTSISMTSKQGRRERSSAQERSIPVHPSMTIGSCG